MYTLFSGTASDIYQTADYLDVFLVDHLGWERRYTIASGVGSRDRVYRNAGGETIGLYDDIYARFNASSGTLYNYAYISHSDVDTTSSGEMGGDEYSANFGGLNDQNNFWFIGDKDFVWVLTRNSVSGTYFSSGVGYVNTFYSSSVDTYPVSVVGQNTSSYDFTNDRVKMYNYANTPTFYHSADYSALVASGTVQARDSSFFGMSVVLINDNIGEYELRGELKGIKQIGGSLLSSQDILYGIQTVASGVYFVIKHESDENTFAYGPYTQIIGV